jgi:hypothetical protein
MISPRLFAPTNRRSPRCIACYSCGQIPLFFSPKQTTKVVGPHSACCGEFGWRTRGSEEFRTTDTPLSSIPFEYGTGLSCRSRSGCRWPGIILTVICVLCLLSAKSPTLSRTTLTSHYHHNSLSTRLWPSLDTRARGSLIARHILSFSKLIVNTVAFGSRIFRDAESANLTQ